MKLLGIDYGRRRIGLAVTDETGSAVRSLPTIDRKKFPDTVTKLAGIILENQPQKIIFGLPLDVEDNETAMSLEVRRFAAEIATRSNLPVDFIDESYSSQQAQMLLRSRRKKQRRQKDAVDRLAACLILQNYQKDTPGDQYE